MEASVLLKISTICVGRSEAISCGSSALVRRPFTSDASRSTTLRVHIRLSPLVNRS